MSRTKKLYALLAVLVILCGMTFVLTQMEERQEQIKTSGETVLAVDGEAVTALSWEYAGDTLAFHRDEEQVWRYDEDEAFPVSEEKVNELLDVFKEFGAAFIIEEVEDFSQYGLDEPECTIQLTTEEQTYEIKLGDFSAMDSQRYVSTGDGNVYLAAVDPLDTYNVTIRGMIQHDDTFDYDQIHTIQFEGKEVHSITYEEESTATYCAEDLYFTTQGGKTVPLDSDLVTDYLSNIVSLSLTNYVTYNATEGELATYGLDDPEFTVTVNYTNEDSENEKDTFVIHVSRNNEDVKAAEETEDDEEIPAYVRIGESQIVYEISEYNYDLLAAGAYNDLRHRELYTGDFAGVTQLDIKLEGSTHTLTADNEDDDRKWRYKENEIEIDDLQDELEGLRAASAMMFTDEMPSGKEEISLIVYQDNENFPQVEIQLYRYDGTDCLAVVDGESVALITRSQVVDLIEAVNAIILDNADQAAE